MKGLFRGLARNAFMGALSQPTAGRDAVSPAQRNVQTHTWPLEGGGVAFGRCLYFSLVNQPRDLLMRDWCSMS